MISAEHQRAIEAAIPDGIKVPDKFWRDLDDALAVFVAMEANRTTRPPWRELEKWKRIEKSAAALIADLKDARPPWLDWALRVLDGEDGKDGIKYRASRAIIGYETLATGYGGRSRPHRELLYASILDLWVNQLGQKLSYSRPPPTRHGEPYGPLIQFFRACVDDAAALTAEGIATIIDRERRWRHEKRPLMFAARKNRSGRRR
jgi:hypothetical protein